MRLRRRERPRGRSGGHGGNRRRRSRRRRDHIGGARGADAHRAHRDRPGGKLLFVVHPDADSVSVVDLGSRKIVHELLLAAATPALDELGRYAPAVGPRALALDSTGRTLYVTGQWSGQVYAIDVASGTLSRATAAAICSEPIGVLVSADDAKLFVACAQDDEVVELAASDLSLVAAVPCPRKPWALAWAPDGTTLYATHLLGPGVSAFATTPLALTTTFPLADGPPGSAQTEPHGPVRGIYDAAVRPGPSELWVAHLMLGIDTPQPALDFQSTVFPALSILGPAGNQLARLSVQANPGRRPGVRRRRLGTTRHHVLGRRRAGVRRRHRQRGRAGRRHRGARRDADHPPAAGAHAGGDRLGAAARSTFRSATARTSPRSRSPRAPPASPSPPTARRSRRSPPTRCRRRCASGRSSSSRPTATTCR